MSTSEAKTPMKAAVTLISVLGLLVFAAIGTGCSDNDSACTTGYYRVLTCGKITQQGTYRQACMQENWVFWRPCQDGSGNVIDGGPQRSDNNCHPGAQRANTCEDATGQPGLRLEQCTSSKEWKATSTCLHGPNGGTFQKEPTSTGNTPYPREMSCKAPVALGQNMIANGTAEADKGEEGEVIDVSCWKRTKGCFTVARYGTYDGIDENLQPPNAGMNYFGGGTGSDCDESNTHGVGLQTIDLAPIITNIQQGNLTFHISGEFGGWSDQDDTAGLEVQFLDASGQTILTKTIGNPSRDQRNATTVFLSDETQGTVPAETTSLEVRIIADGPDGIDNDGYADNLSILFSK